MPLTPPLILTPGEPGGIGMEIAAKAWLGLREESHCGFAIIADCPHFKQMARQAGIDVQLTEIRDLADAATVFANALPVMHRPLPAPVQAGSFTAATARWVTIAIEEAFDLCLGGKAAAMVTNPIQKEALYAAGFAHQGHTDFLAHLARQRGHDANDVMMLVGGGLRTVPVTVHIALKDVPAALTGQAIETQAQIVDEALRRNFGLAQPRIAVTGLNPHAGESGAMGREEIDVILPAVARMKAQGLNIAGPLPADTAFHADARSTYDAILCMYHDQALIPVKTLDFHGGVNVTLGLPIIRTSPDHGTALGIAGTGKARADSLIAAIKLAQQMSTAAASA